ncbi:MAG TPA: C1 family peptidase [Candidatus Binatia bacterium]
MLRATLALLVLLAVSACSDGKSTSQDELDDFGGTPPTDEELATYPKALPAAAFADDGPGSILPPTSVIPEDRLPPVQAQGTPAQLGYPGSCEVWSAGYAMGSYAANLANQKNIKDIANTVSAAYVYMTVLAEENEMCGVGTSPAYTLNYLVKQTAPSLESIPYYPVCECPPDSDQCLDAIQLDQSCATNQAFCTDLRIGGWQAFAKEPIDQTLDVIKSWIAQHYVAQMSIVVPFGFPDYVGGLFSAFTECPPDTKCAMYNGIACMPSQRTKTGCAQHGVAIVGYDDARGALKIQNSFGPGWGEAGYMWMSYSTFAAIYLSGTIAFPPIEPIKDGDVASASAVERGFQWVERRDGATSVHLVFTSTLPEPLSLDTITVTAPDGTTITHEYGGHGFQAGYHYVTRHDGKQFEPGLYAVRLAGRTSAGEQRVFDGAAQVALVEDESLSPAPPGDDVTGTNRGPASLTR